MDSSLPGSSVHGFSQARILEWVAMLSSRGSSRPRDQIRVSSLLKLAGRFFPTSPTWEAISYLPNWDNTKSTSWAVMRNIFILFIFRPYHMAHGILVPQPGVEPKPAALGARSLSHWTTRQIPIVRNKGEMGIELPVQCLERWMLSRSELRGGLFFSPVFHSSVSDPLPCSSASSRSPLPRVLWQCCIFPADHVKT